VRFAWRLGNIVMGGGRARLPILTPLMHRSGPVNTPGAKKAAPDGMGQLGAACMGRAGVITTERRHALPIREPPYPAPATVASAERHIFHDTQMGEPPRGGASS
jgi:hypothetical protein